MSPPRATGSSHDAFPERIAPMLAVASATPVSGPGWAVEFKWDGVRAVTYVEGTTLRASSRNDKDLTATFPELAELVTALHGRSAVLDGELVAFDQAGRPSFALLASRLHLSAAAEIRSRAAKAPASYLVFDLLYYDGHLLVSLPFSARRKALEALGLTGDHLAVPPSFVERDALDVLEASRQGGLEGIVAKRLDAPYRPGERSGAWVKVKNFRTQEVVIGGWTEGRGEREGSLGALLLGIPGHDGLAYAGKVGTGFNTAARRVLLELLAPLAVERSPFVVSPNRSEAPRPHYVRPELVGEVQYGEWTKDGRLRHPSWRGLREDKSPGEVVHEDVG